MLGVVGQRRPRRMSLPLGTTRRAWPVDWRSRHSGMQSFRKARLPVWFFSCLRTPSITSRAASGLFRPRAAQADSSSFPWANAARTGRSSRADAGDHFDRLELLRTEFRSRSRQPRGRKAGIVAIDAGDQDQNSEAPVFGTAGDHGQGRRQYLADVRARLRLTSW